MDFILNMEKPEEGGKNQYIIQFSLNTDGFVMRGNKNSTEFWPLFIRFKDIKPLVKIFFFLIIILSYEITFQIFY